MQADKEVKKIENVSAKVRLKRRTFVILCYMHGRKSAAVSAAYPAREPGCMADFCDCGYILPVMNVSILTFIVKML